MVFGLSICSAEVPASIARKFQGFGQKIQRRSAIHFNQQTTHNSKGVSEEAPIFQGVGKPPGLRSRVFFCLLLVSFCS